MKKLLVMVLIALLLAGNSLLAQSFDDPLGDYKVQGTNYEGGRYNGAAQLSAYGETIKVDWNFGGKMTTGIGLFLEDRFAVTYGGDNCGIAIYAVQPDGSMAGLWTMMNSLTTGTEVARSADQTYLYNVSGTNPPKEVGGTSTNYKGTLELEPFEEFFPGYDPGEYDVYLSHWETDKSATGIGILQDGFFATTFGGENCALAFYVHHKRGRIVGIWTAPLLPGVGRETLTPRN